MALCEKPKVTSGHSGLLERLSVGFVGSVSVCFHGSRLVSAAARSADPATGELPVQGWLRCFGSRTSNEGKCPRI